MSRTTHWTTRGTYNFESGTTAEIIIHFISQGYYNPGCTYGDPSRCYPPEGDDERTLDYVEIILDANEQTGENIILRADQATGQALFDKYEDEINAVELIHGDDDGPDHYDY
jgi:hypothetical protein